MIVPPVPTPLTKMSILPSVSRQISSAVVRRWISGLAGFLNCWGMYAFGRVLDQLLGLADRTRHPLGGRRQHDLGPKALSSRRRSRLMLSGIVTISR